MKRLEQKQSELSSRVEIKKLLKEVNLAMQARGAPASSLGAQNENIHRIARRRFNDQIMQVFKVLIEKDPALEPAQHEEILDQILDKHMTKYMRRYDDAKKGITVSPITLVEIHTDIMHALDSPKQTHLKPFPH